MTDLEDRILKRNVPGRYSQWNDDNDKMYDKNEENDDEIEKEHKKTMFEQVQEMERNEIPKPLQIASISNQTGVKGVLQDYKQHQKIKEHNKLVEKQEREAILYRMAHGSTSTVHDFSKTDEDDNAFFDIYAYRNDRLKQLQYEATATTTQKHKGNCNSSLLFNSNIYGEICEVDIMEYAEIIDAVDSSVKVMIHLYQPYIGECTKLNLILEKMARKVPHVKFMRMQALESFDIIALPVLMIYQGGELIKKWVRVTDYFGHDYNIESVMHFLVREEAGIILPSTAPEFKNFALEMNEHEHFGSSYRREKDVEADSYGSSDAELDEFCKDFQPL